MCAAAKVVGVGERGAGRGEVVVGGGCLGRGEGEEVGLGRGEGGEVGKGGIAGGEVVRGCVVLCCNVVVSVKCSG